MWLRAFQNEVDVGKLTGSDIFPFLGSSEVHWYHFRRNPPVFGRAQGPRVFVLFFLPFFGPFQPQSDLYRANYKYFVKACWVALAFVSMMKT